MRDKPSFRPFLYPTLFLVALGWGGLALVMHYTRPTLWPRWGFFALLVMACTGATLPISYFINQRLMGKDAGVVTRQSVWVGIYAAVLAWLEMGRVLSFSVALWLLLGFMGVEYLVQLRDRLAHPPVKDDAGEESVPRSAR